MYREEVLIRGSAGLVERQVKELRHKETDNAKHGNATILELSLLRILHEYA